MLGLTMNWQQGNTKKGQQSTGDKKVTLNRQRTQQATGGKKATSNRWQNATSNRRQKSNNIPAVKTLRSISNKQQQERRK